MSHTEPPYEETASSQGAEENQQPEKNPWDAIAKDFQKLGQNIADTIKDAWQSEDSKKQLADLRQGLQEAADQMVNAVDAALKSPAVAEAKTEAKKAAGDVKGMGEKAYAEVKPQLVNALKKLSEGIQNVVAHLESAPPPPAGAETDANSDET